MSFKPDFVWGVATAAYQIEGAANEDGKGPSIWDAFCCRPGKVWNGQTGDVACDHYHRFKEDIALMRQIGIKAYRFSISWPRVIPEGTGTVNLKGLNFYDRLVDELLRAGIVPYITLYHWDQPLSLFSKGGWLNPDSPDWFAEFTAEIVSKLSDRVENWFTLNEPQCIVKLGHLEGKHAPGVEYSVKDSLQVGHNLLLAHGKSVQVIRSLSKKSSKVGLASFGVISVPASDKAADIEGAKRATLSVTTKNSWNNTWWLDPIFLGRYPEDGLELYGPDLPTITPEHLKLISQPIDFCGLNIYWANRIKAGKDGLSEVELSPNQPLTAFKWTVDPEALYWGPRFIWERYHKPIIISENGLSNTDWVSLDGQVHDPQRIDFITRYLRELKRAVADGVQVDGYFHWSIMDNFEWAEGFKERFGLIYVDFATQKRIFKDSAYWYKELVSSNGAILD